MQKTETQKYRGAQLRLSSRTSACMRPCSLTNYFCLHMGAAGSSPPGRHQSKLVHCTRELTPGSWAWSFQHTFTHTQMRWWVADWGCHSGCLTGLLLHHMEVTCTMATILEGILHFYMLQCVSTAWLASASAAIFSSLFFLPIFTRQACCWMCNLRVP